VLLNRIFWRLSYVPSFGLKPKVWGWNPKCQSTGNWTVKIWLENVFSRRQNGVFGAVDPKWEPYVRNPKRYILPRVRVVWTITRENPWRIWPVGKLLKKGYKQKLVIFHPFVQKTPWTDVHLIWHSCRGRRHNHVLYTHRCTRQKYRTASMHAVPCVSSTNFRTTNLVDVNWIVTVIDQQWLQTMFLLDDTVYYSAIGPSWTRTTVADGHNFFKQQ